MDKYRELITVDETRSEYNKEADEASLLINYYRLGKNKKIFELSLEEIKQKIKEDSLDLLLITCLNNDHELFQYLVSLGADINQTSRHEPLISCYVRGMNHENCNMDILEYLCENTKDLSKKYEGIGGNLFFTAFGNYELTRKAMSLLLKYIDLSEQSIYYFSASEYILDESRIKVGWINFLREYFTKLEEKNKDGKTALYVAIEEGNVIAMKTLIKKGSQIKGFSARESLLKCKKNKFEIYKILKKRFDFSLEIILKLNDEQITDDYLVNFTVGKENLADLSKLEINENIYEKIVNKFLGL